MSRPLRLAVFDVDGTLIDSQHNIVAAMTLAFRAYDLDDPEPAAVRRIIGLSLTDAVSRLLPAGRQDDRDLLLPVAHAYKDAFFTLRTQRDHHEPLFPGIAQAVAALADAGWLLGVATGKSQRGLEAMIARHGFGGVFVTCQTADDNPGKPHPAMVLRALAETGVEAGNAVMIGDTSFDMAMGRAAHVHTLGVAWGYHPVEELTAAGAEALVDDCQALPAMVNGLVERTAACASARS